MAPHPLDTLRGTLRNERTGLVLGATALEAIAIAIVLPISPQFCRYISMDNPGGAAYVLWALGIGGALGIAFMVKRAIALRDVDRAEMTIKLLHDPEDIVWAHAGLAIAHRVQGQTVSRSRYVTILTESGDNHSLEMRESNALALLYALEGYLPHATIGEFSQEALTRYRADPASMRLTPRIDAREGGSYRESAEPAKKKTLPAAAGCSYWLAALVCVAPVLAAPSVTSVIMSP